MSEGEFGNKTVVITGGTGSFGSTMVRHLLDLGAGEVRIFSRDEAKQDSLRHQLQSNSARFYIGDVRDPDSVRNVIRGADLVFHAAALKQVPSAEFFPIEAVMTNVLGSANVLRAAIDNQVKAIVCLSTDKAVYPINAMGQTKALMEKTALSYARNAQDHKTKICVTRYGNVMASRGSAIPLFISQIKSGLPITITNGEMTRFLMSLDESVDLVMHAFEKSDSGDLLVRKAPAATVENLVLALCQIFKLETPEIRVIGTRHGEKLFESLLSAEERAKALDEGQYFRVPLDTRSLDYSIYTDSGLSLEDLEPYTSHNTERLTVEEIRTLLLGLPEVQRELF